MKNKTKSSANTGEAVKTNNLPIDGVIDCLQYQTRLLTYLIETKQKAAHLIDVRDATVELCDKVLYFRLLKGLEDQPHYKLEIDRIKQKLENEVLGEYDPYQHGFLEGKLAGFPFAFPELWERLQS